jgi:hypothetical protein
MPYRRGAAHMKSRVLNISLWFLFAIGLALATSPVWQRAVYGFNPTFDEIVRTAVCRPAP